MKEAGNYLVVRYPKEQRPTLELMTKDEVFAGGQEIFSNKTDLPTLSPAATTVLEGLLETEHGREVVQKLSENGFSIGFGAANP
ncbi:MAG TPA: hypothetical protein VJB98_03195 [Candidatus Paceibacterota bacterium]